MTPFTAAPSLPHQAHLTSSCRGVEAHPSPPQLFQDQFTTNDKREMRSDYGHSSPEWRYLSSDGRHSCLDSGFSSPDFASPSPPKCRHPSLRCGGLRDNCSCLVSQVGDTPPLPVFSPLPTSSLSPVRPSLSVQPPVPFHTPLLVHAPLSNRSPFPVRPSLYFRNDLPARAPFPVHNNLPIRLPLSVPNDLPVRAPMHIRGPFPAVPSSVERIPVPQVDVDAKMMTRVRSETERGGGDQVSQTDRGATLHKETDGHRTCSLPYRFSVKGLAYPLVGRSRRRGGQVRFTCDQTSQLEAWFSRHKYITPPQRKTIARDLNLQERQVITWFQNRRAKVKRLKAQSEEPRIR
ncbi:hematopoietically-expressed homeobox protein HHEX homolog [Homarus americanus]|uniref:hematopoietically-expressed homeobox protein HHEX homolog n=1 Tax=Homarus americanus TaxID=6706 RepID=UPI001C48D0D1|nr:hematopoietically-expressed homeobox protein HHEX homolog [Homarus americanus]